MEVRLPQAEKCLGTAALRRICIGLITAEQDRMLRRGAIGQAQADVLRQPGLTPAQLDAILIDEETIGFDSLNRLDLIMLVNRLFGLSATGVEDYLVVQRRIGDWVALLAQHLGLAGPKLTFTFATSGSSGPPKEIRHGVASLFREIGSHLAVIGSTIPPVSRIVSLVPPQHIYGFLWTCLLPESLGVPVLDLHSAGPTSALRHARAGDLIIGTPFNWGLLVRAHQLFPPGVAGIVSAGPSQPALWPQLKEGGLSDLIEIYGATETGGVGFRSDPMDAFELLPHLEKCDGGVRAGGTVLPLQDQVTWVAERRFTVTGRIDAVVQVGGVNVSPEHLRLAILDDPQVSEAAVRLDGDRLKAFVVPCPFNPLARDVLEARLRKVLRAQFPAAAIPQSIRFGTGLPRNAMGKLTDWAPETSAPFETELIKITPS